MGKQLPRSVTIEVKTHVPFEAKYGRVMLSRELHVLFHVAFVISDIRKNVDTGVTLSAGRDRYWRRCVTFIHQTKDEREIREERPL